MPPTLALIACTVLVLVLLYIEHNRNPTASVAVWVPTAWLMLCGSKPLAKWFEVDTFSQSMTEEDGSPLDRMVLIVLILLALFIIRKRNIQWSRIIKDHLWLTVLFLYLGSSILWSDFPFVSFKRWLRLLGAVPIAMVIMSEREPLSALESVFRRCGYVLIPFSLLLIRYYERWGVAYVTWSGEKMWVGVASQKNGFGVICALSAFLVIWALQRDRRSGALRKARSQLFADLLVLAIAVYLLKGFQGSYAATATGMLLAGTASLWLLSRTKNYARPAARLLICTVAFVLLCLPFADSWVPSLTSVFQRNSSFTGRTDIWQAVLDAASQNPVFGVGYGGFWGLKDQTIFSTLGVRESHSGYLDVYLEGGMLAVIFCFAFLLAYFKKALRRLDYSYDWALFSISFLVMILIHNFTESNFLRTSSYFWNSLIFVTIVFLQGETASEKNPVFAAFGSVRPKNRTSAAIKI